MTPSLGMLSRLRRTGAVILAGVLLAALVPAAALAVVPPMTAVPATFSGAPNISADTAAASPGTGAYTTLTGPSIVEGSVGDLAAGTVVLQLPSGYTYSGSGLASLAANGGGACTNLSVTPSVTFNGGLTTATVTLTGASTGTPCTLTFTSLRIRPTDGTPLAATGHITNTGSSGPNSVSDNYGTLTEVAGAPLLSFSVQPSATATAGQPFAQQPTVLSQDRFGNLRSGDSIALAIRSGTGISGATLTCTTNPLTTNGSGVAAFGGCKLDKSGTTPYQLQAATAGATTVFSSGIVVSPGTAVQLGFVQQPGRGTPGAAFLSQPIVAIQDALGNTVTTASSSGVSLTMVANPSGGTLTCTTNPMPTSSGVATFSGCRINLNGVGYTVMASAAGLTSATSNAFDVADRLVFTQQPSGGVAGQAFTTQPIVTVRSGPTNVAVHDQVSQVTLSIQAGTGTAGAKLTCTNNPVTVANGAAFFQGCSIDKVSPSGNPYVLLATVASSGLTAAISTGFTVTPGPPVKLAFLAEPNAATSMQAFATQPQVAIVDAGGNVVTTASATITLGIWNNPAAGTLTCTGGNVRTTTLGVATFTGCSINNAGAGYTLSAIASNATPVVSLTMAVSDAFNVLAPAAQITLSTSASVITWSQPVTVTAQFGTNGAGKIFTLQVSADGVNWVIIATPTTNSLGTASFAWTPARNFWYRAVFAGTPDLSAANSNTIRVVVRQIALLRPTLGGKVRTIVNGTSITFTTTVRPARPELPKAKVTFTFQLYRAGHVVYNGKRDVYIDSLGLAKWTWKFGTSGEWYVRAIANPTTANANSVWSQIEHYHVP